MENPIIIGGVLLLVVAAVGKVWLDRQRAKAIAHWLAEEGQYQPADKLQLAEALHDATQSGKGDDFQALLTMVQKRFGEDGVKLGHLYWIWEQLENNISAADVKMIPPFNQR